MSTSWQLGQLVNFEGKECYVVRIVASSTLFEEPGKSYIVEETYAELRSADGTVIFPPSFTTLTHEFEKDSQIKHKGVDPRVWRRF